MQAVFGLVLQTTDERTLKVEMKNLWRMFYAELCWQHWHKFGTINLEAQFKDNDDSQNTSVTVGNGR